MVPKRFSQRMTTEITLESDCLCPRVDILVDRIRFYRFRPSSRCIYALPLTHKKRFVIFVLPLCQEIIDRHDTGSIQRYTAFLAGLLLFKGDSVT